MDIFIFLMCVLGSFFFAAYETCFYSANLIRIRHLAEKENNKTAVRLLAHYKDPGRLITLMLVGTNLVLVIGTISLSRAVGAGWTTLIATPVYLFVGEIVRKSIARHFPMQMVLPLFPLVTFFDRLLAPITWPIVQLSKLVLKMLGREGEHMKPLAGSREDVRILVDESHDQGALDPEEHEMIHSVIALQNQSAKEVMVPRMQMLALPESATRHELTAFFIESGRTRLPVYADTVDQIVGVVNAFDLIKDTRTDRQDIARFIKPIIHVPDTMKLDDVLKVMRDARQSVAIVTDEHGGTDGLITLEDILEQIFGEIHDEYDLAPTQLKKIGPDAYFVDAQMPLEAFCEALHIPLIENGAETVGGWVTRLAGCIPERGQVIPWENHTIIILEGAPNYISSIRLELNQEKAPEHDQA
ncbi:MAG TPA: hemolysin family protein [Candidatus Hydrogenedentes bacterium]|nr:hemolysin family protein [Candidatus Hydrogenedentota bacterium]